MIKKTSWVFLGIFLWGIPTAVFLSLLLAVKKPGTWLESQTFDQAVFIKSLFITVPIFVVGGILYGLFMNKMTGHKSKKV
jgi:hypothetical protein